MNRLYSPLFVSFLALCVPLAAQDHDLRITAKKGASLWYVQETRQEQSIDMGGQQMDMGNTMTFTVLATVKEIDDQGLLTVEATIKRVKGAMSIPMLGDVEFDSIDQKPGDAAEAGKEDEGDDMGMGMPDMDAIGRGMGSLAGTTFVAKVDPFGVVKSIDGLDKAIEAAKKKAGRMGAQMLGGALNDKAMETLIESAFGILPNKPLAVGATWERNEDGKSARMPIANKMTLTLAKVEADSFEITATGTIEKPAADAKADDQAKEGEGEEEAMAREMMAKMKIENGKIAGGMKISRQDGFVIESNSEVSMEITMPGPMGGDMAITQKNTTTTRRTSEAEAMAKPKAAEAPKDEGKEPAKDAGK